MAKNPFTKASEIQRYLKVLVFGASGTGKTYFALNSPRPCAMIDLEGGSAHYGEHPVIGGFDRISTRSLREIEQAVSYCAAGDYATLVIDPITVLWQLLQDAAMEVVQRRGGRSDLESSLTPRDWGAIKRKYNSLMTSLVNLPCNVVICSREKELVKVDRSGNMEVVGTKADAEKSTPYLPDVTLQLQERDGKRIGIVHKDRTGTFDPWSKIDAPALSMWLQKSHTTGRVERIQTDEEAAKENASAFAEDLAPHTVPIDSLPPKNNGDNGTVYGPPKSGTQASTGNGNNQKNNDAAWKKWMASVHAAAHEYGLEHDDLHTLFAVDSLKDLSPDDLRDMPGTLRLWDTADKEAGVPALMKELREDLEAAETLDWLANTWIEVWAPRMKGWSRLAKIKANKIKETCKAQLAEPTEATETTHTTEI